MAVVYWCVGILTADVVFFRSPGVFHSQDSFPSTFHPLQRPLLKMSPTAEDEHRGEGILRMEDTGTSEEDDIDSQDSNTPIDHGHQARNCSIKINFLTT